MVKNDICLGVASKQNGPFLKKSCPKKRIHIPNV